MQRKCEIATIVKTSWGVLEEQKQAIMSGGFGALRKALQIVRDKEFYSIDEVAAMLDVSLPTAWRKVHKAELKYIVDRRKYLFYFKDIKNLD